MVVRIRGRRLNNALNFVRSRYSFEARPTALSHRYNVSTRTLTQRKDQDAVKIVDDLHLFARCKDMPQLEWGLDCSRLSNALDIAGKRYKMKDMMLSSHKWARLHHPNTQQRQ